MPINPIVLQRRHAELGRIRLGEKVEMSGGRTRPGKLEHFRFTSPNERMIRDLAELYGGEPRPWVNGTKSEWEVYSTAKAVPVAVVKGGISQWLETWSGGGCTHRCDGITNVLTDSACDPDDSAHQAAKPTTRLSVMLPELGAVGVWRLESHGWNSAAELPGVVELAMHVGDLVEAHLVLHERTAIKDGKTSKFVVPGLDLDITHAQLRGIIMGSSAHAIDAAAPAALGAGGQPAALPPAPAPVDWEGMLADASTEQECRGIWDQAGASGQLTDYLKAAIQYRASEINPPKPAEVVSGEAAARINPGPAPATAPATTGTPDDAPQAAGDSPADVDTAWSALVATAGAHGLNDGQLRSRFKATTGHGVETATVAELATVRAALDGTPVLTGEVIA